MTKSKGIRDKQVTSTTKFIEKCDELFGEGVLDYSKVDYKNSTTKVLLRCVEHDLEYLTRPNSVISKKSTCCPACQVKVKRDLFKTDKSLLISLLDEKMLGGYRIINLDYDNSNSLVDLECPKHGVFQKTVLGIKSAKKYVCPRCSQEHITANKRKASWIKWRDVLEKRHPSMDFSMFKYEGKNVKSSVSCPVHGSFQSSVANLVHINTPCPMCYNSGRAVDGQTFEAKAREVHGDLYDYTKAAFQYSDSHTLVEIYCNHCEEYFKQNPNNHLLGKGCRKCAGRNIAQVSHWNNPTSLAKKPYLMYKPTYLYVFALSSLDSSTRLYKVGITYEGNLEERIRTLTRESGYKVEPLHLFKSTRIDCLWYENRFHKDHKEISYMEKDRHYGGKHEVYYASGGTLQILSHLLEDVRGQNTFEEVDYKTVLTDEFKSLISDYELKYVK